MNENESLTVTLTLENNEEIECAVLNIFEADEKEYMKSSTVFPLYSTNGWIHRISAISILMH